MIRSALIALGLSAGGLGATATQAQWVLPTAPILEACGGTRLDLDAVLLDEAAGDVEAWEKAADVVSARIGGLYGATFDFVDVTGDRLVVSLPSAFNADVGAIETLLEDFGLGIYAVERFEFSENELELADGQFALLTQDMPDQVAVLQSPPIVTGAQIARAEATFDQNNQPAISFRFTADGATVFGQYTTDNIGNSIAIVLKNEVLSAPRIMSAITGGNGMITGNFTTNEVQAIAAVLNSGALPFELTIVAQDTMDGSDPSADFCP